MAAIGLNAAQTSALNASWKKIESDKKTHGANFFMAIFKKHPDAQNLFPALKGQATGSLANSSAMKAQGLGFMSELGGMLDTLDNKEDLEAMFRANARKHHQRGISADLYEAVMVVLCDYMHGACGADSDAAWKAFTGALCSAVRTEYGKL